ncbi:alpha/beta-hydrolase [Cantharellus anzutake]|uniref:alpha/beta-hydrolase n=1 Tax=Cantharellus anzutake TaxID=1750568 RepID=UPI0019071437|nr:alpha/beta-hydrolase [Cantharellus anzutake]KAF8337504.1 alpha/beta-hydrolase [Cantharellus anzutake]
MGLNNTTFAWRGQVRHFGKHEKYSVLAFDNRGVGNSDTPSGPYSTSTMAEDVITLLDYVGWKGRRQLHVIGISMGGMIAMELATRIPDRIATLGLISTKSGPRGLGSFPSYKGLSNLLRSLGTRDPKKKIPYAIEMLYPPEYLESPVPGDPDGKTGWEVQKTNFLTRMEVSRPQQLIGALSQLAATVTHNVSPERLASIAKSIPKILILTGDSDKVVDPRNSYLINEDMREGSVEFVVWEKTGHAPNGQWPQRFNELIERVCADGREKSSPVSS